MVEITYQMVLSTLQTVGLLVGIAYYLFIMRNSQRNQELTLKAQQQALETRQAQLFMNIYNQSFANPQYLKSWTKVYDTPWDSYEEFKALYHPDFREDDDFQLAYDVVGCFLEGVGVLVRENMLDVRWVALLMTGSTRRYWEKTQPIIGEFRRDYDNPRIWSETEYLYNELIKYLEEHPELKT
jgi:hypothetical protein